MSTYGDRGNVIALKKRCEWRGIDVKVRKLDVGFTENDIETCDFLFMGGAQDRQQQIVAKDLANKKDVLKKMVEDEVPGLFVCGAYQFLGKYYREVNGDIVNGLGILDLFTQNPGISFSRLIGNVVVELLNGYKMVGFENHGGRTYLGSGLKPLGRVIKGFGNNGEDQTEGVIYKNVFGTYLHGPVLPKNPKFADLLIRKTLEKKYKHPVKIVELDDALENSARDAIAKRLGVKL